MTNDFELVQPLLNSRGREAEEAIIAFSKHLSLQPLNASNVNIYCKILNRNLPEAADILFSRRKPPSFFSVIPLSHDLVSFGTGTLSEYKSSELYSPIAESCLGILVNCYKNHSNSMTIYPLSITEIYHIAKYLEKNEDFLEALILDLLESIGNWQSGMDISKMSHKIINNWFDSSKTLNQIIPSTILM